MLPTFTKKKFYIFFLTLTSPVLFDSSLTTSAGTAATTALVESPFLSAWRPFECEVVAGGIVVDEPLEVNAAPEDVDLVIPLDSGFAGDDPLLGETEVAAMVTSGDLGGCWCCCCLALKGLVDLDLFESKVRPTLEALEPRLKKNQNAFVIMDTMPFEKKNWTKNRESHTVTSFFFF